MTQSTHPTTITTHTPPPSPPHPAAVDILILGAGWSTQFLLPLLTTHNLTNACTTRDGRNNTIPFLFTPASTSRHPYTLLPRASYILITFPLKGPGQSKLLTSLYGLTHPDVNPDPNLHNDSSTPTPPTRWIQLGSTGIFTARGWNASTSPLYDRGNSRAVAEDELLSLPLSPLSPHDDSTGASACVLNLAGLYDDRTRRPRDWVRRVARCKEDVRAKGALHLVHGEDVARGVVGVVLLGGEGGWGKVGGRRWIVCDLRVYDWWDLIMGWGGEVEVEGERERVEYRRWVMELMREEGMMALPREKEALGRVLDGRDFWEAIGSWPGVGRVT